MLVKDSHLKDYDKIERSMHASTFFLIIVLTLIVQLVSDCHALVLFASFYASYDFDCMLTWLRKLRNLLLLCVYDQWIALIEFTMCGCLSIPLCRRTVCTNSEHIKYSLR